MMDNVEMADEHDIDMDYDEGDSEVDIEELHKTCVNNLASRRSKIPAVISIPDLYTMYFKPGQTDLPLVPEDLQLPIYFAFYDEFVANANFVVCKTMARDVRRAMWFYGIDKGHTLFNYSGQIRLNVIIMVFLCTSRFDPKYCQAGTREFVERFLKVRSRHTVSRSFTYTNAGVDGGTHPPARRHSRNFR